MGEQSMSIVVAVPHSFRDVAPSRGGVEALVIPCAILEPAVAITVGATASRNLMKKKWNVLHGNHRST